MELAEHPKNITPAEVYRSEWRRLRGEKYTNHIKVFTGGSKTEAGVGAAAMVKEDRFVSATLSKAATIYSAEAHAIAMAISEIKQESAPRVVIYSDSYSVLRSLAEVNYANPVVRKIQHNGEEMAGVRKKVKFCWIPGQAGIRGNEKPDLLAKMATTKQPQCVPVLYTNCKEIIREKITWQWNKWWQQSGEKLLEIKGKVGQWKTEGRKTREVAINR